MMKRILFTVVIVLFSVSLQAQTLFTYGDKQVDQENFLRAYKKNNIEEPDKEKAIREYLDLYINFKLKVEAAYAEGIDTLPQIVNDIEQFRQQIADGYLLNKEGRLKLEKEAIERIKKDIHVQHYFVPVAANASPEELAKAEAAAKALYEGLNTKNINEVALLQELSQKFVACRTTDLGYITAFSIPYAYENIVYQTEKGKTSSPYLNEKGWHLFKIHNIRKSAGRWRVAQILFSFPPDASSTYKLSMQQKADSVYQLLLSGKMNFETAAKSFSNDRLTYMSGGEMPEFGTGKYTGSFEDAVFALQKDGDITKPFETSYGIHIVKRLAQSPIDDITEQPIAMMEIKQKIEEPDRIEGVNRAFKEELAEKIKFNLQKGVELQSLLQEVSATNHQSPADSDKQHPIYSRTIGHIEQETLLGKDWLNYIRVAKSNKVGNKPTSPVEIWKDFLHHKRLDFYRRNLEQYNPEFRYQMEEFKEGNMLFEIMERKIWNKAITDTSGTRAVYESNKHTYLWQPSADMLIFNCHSEAAANSAMQELQQGKVWSRIAEESKGLVQADSGRYELEQILISDPGFTIQNNAITPVEIGSDGSAAFVKFIKLYPGNELRRFEEAKGLAISDYQTLLEKNWLTNLKKKHPVKLNKRNINRMMKAELK